MSNRKPGSLSERLACVQIIQNLEARYTNEMLAWLLVLLTLIVMELSLVQVSGSTTLSASQKKLSFIAYYTVIAFPTFVSLVGLISAYLAARVVGAVLSGHTIPPKLATFVLESEETSRSTYCGRMRHEDYCKELRNRATTIVAICIHGEIERYLDDVRKPPDKVCKDYGGIPAPDLVAAMISLTLFTSGPMTELLHFINFIRRRARHILATITVIVIMLSVARFVVLDFRIEPFISIMLIGTYLSLAIYIVAIAILYRMGEGGRCSSPRPIDAVSGSAKQSDLAIARQTVYRAGLRSYIAERLSFLQRLRCSLGLDRASICCLTGAVHYCIAGKSLSKPALVPSLLITLVIYTTLLWLTIG